MRRVHPLKRTITPPYPGKHSAQPSRVSPVRRTEKYARAPTIGNARSLSFPFHLPAPWKRVDVASSVDRQSKGGVNFRHTKRRCFSVWLSTGTLTGFTSLKRFANDINGAGQVVGEPCRKRVASFRLPELSSPASRRRIEPRWKFPDLPCPASLSLVRIARRRRRGHRCRKR